MSKLFDILVPDDIDKQKNRYFLMKLGKDSTRLIWVTIAYYMIAVVISKILFEGLNLYFSAILAGLTGAAWGYVITTNVEHMKKTMKNEKWFSPEECYSLFSSFGKKGFQYFFIIFVEIILIWYFKIY